MSDYSTYGEFLRMMRRFRKSSVLQTIAEVSARQELGGRSAPREAPTLESKFLLSGVARTALVSCSEYRSREFGEEDLQMCTRAYINIQNPPGQGSGLSELRPMLTRIAYEQFPFQIGEGGSMGRVVPVVADTQLERALRPGESWERLLGCSLTEFLRLGFVIYALSLRRGGRVSRDLLADSEVSRAMGSLASRDVSAIIDNWLAADVGELEKVGRLAERRGVEKWCFNPLLEKPLMNTTDGWLLPVQSLLLRRVSLEGLYFIGAKAWGSRFTNELGRSFERYVGRQLELLEHCLVVPQQPYGKPQRLSVDYFLLAGRYLILVEVKTSRPVEALRTGESIGEDDMLCKVTEALDQIAESHRALVDGDIDLGRTIAGMTILGMVVTMEPFFLVNTPFYEEVLSACPVRARVVSVADLERFVAACSGRRDTGSRFAKALDSPGRPELAGGYDDLSHRVNPVLDRSWEVIG